MAGIWTQHPSIANPASVSPRPSNGSGSIPSTPLDTEPPFPEGPKRLSIRNPDPVPPSPSNNDTEAYNQAPIKPPSPSRAPTSSESRKVRFDSSTSSEMKPNPHSQPSATRSSTTSHHRGTQVPFSTPSPESRASPEALLTGAEDFETIPQALKSISTKHSNLQIRIARLKRLSTRLTDENDSLRQQNSLFVSDIQNLEAQVRAADSTVFQNASRGAEPPSEREPSTGSALKSALNEAQTAKDALMTAQIEIQVSRDKVDDLLHEKAQLSSQIQTLQQERDAAVLRNASLQAEMRKAKREDRQEEPEPKNSQTDGPKQVKCKEPGYWKFVTQLKTDVEPGVGRAWGQEIAVLALSCYMVVACAALLTSLDRRGALT